MNGLRRLTILLALSTVGVGASGLVALIRAECEFPHAEHEGLFPLCSGCHAGIETVSARAEWYPEPASCAACHDGEREDPVEWTERPYPSPAAGRRVLFDGRYSRDNTTARSATSRAPRARSLLGTG